MRLLIILLLLSIFFELYENKEIKIIRKLEVDGTDTIDTAEPDTSETSNSYDFPSHSPVSDSAEGSYEYPSHSPISDSAEGSYDYPSHSPISDSANNTFEEETTTIPFIVPTHPPATTSTPSDDNINPGPGGQGGSTSEYSYNLPDYSPNGTLSDEQILSTFPYTPSTAKPKLVLLGFGGFQKIESPPTQPDQQEITILAVIIFRVFFKRYLFVGGLQPYMHFHVDLTYSRLLRNLEEKLANCVKIKDEGDDIEYNCTIPDIEPNSTIETLASKNDYTFNNGTHDEPASEDNGYEFYQSSYANSTANNIQKQITTELSHTIVVNNAKLNVPNSNKPYFEIVGYSDSIINDNEVTFSFDEKGDGKLKNVTCAVVPLSVNDKKYQFNCETEKSLRVNINSAMGKSSNGINVLLNFDKDAEGDYNDLLIINNQNNFYGNRYGSSEGLSGGAIAGIVIACVCALILIGLLAFCCKNKGNPPPIQETVMQIYSSNSNADNI